MKIRDRFDEPRSGNIHKIRLELAENSGGFVCLILRFQNIIAFRPFDEKINAPVIVFLIHNVGFPVLRKHQSHGLARILAFPAEMFGHSLDIIHQTHRIAEYIRVDPLEDIMNYFSALVICHAIGIVDVPVPERFNIYEFSVKTEL